MGTEDPGDLCEHVGEILDEYKGQPLAPVAAALPVSDAYDIDDRTLPHFEEKVMPETSLTMGTGPTKVPVLAMWDSGSFYNIMKTSTAQKIGARIDVNAVLPCMSLANEHVVRASGKVRVDVDFGGRTMNVTFYTMDELAYPAIMGSHFAISKGVVIDRGEANEIRLQVARETAHIPFSDHVRKRTHADVDMMYVTETMLIPPNTVRNVPLRFKNTRHGLPDQWGFMVDAKIQGVAIPQGFTCVVAEAQEEAHYFCQVANMSDKPAILDTERPLVIFKPCGGHIDDDHLLVDGEDFVTPAPANLAAPSMSELDADDLKAEWAGRPHLKDLDLSMARKSMSSQGVLKLTRLILDHHELWDTRPKEPPSDADTCTFKVREDIHWAAKTRPLNPPMRGEL